MHFQELQDLLFYIAGIIKGLVFEMDIWSNTLMRERQVHFETILHSSFPTSNKVQAEQKVVIGENRGEQMMLVSCDDGVWY